MMQNFFNVLPIVQDVILALLFVRGILILRKRETGKKNHGNVVALSQILLWMGFCGGSVLSIPVTIFGPDGLQGGVGFLLEAMILLCIAMLLAYCNETIIYDDAKFTATNFVGMKRRFDYEEITAISRKNGDTFLHTGRGRVRIDAISEGGNAFIKKVDAVYEKHHGQHIPVKPLDHDPFNGNLNYPWLLFIIDMATVFMGLFFIILSIQTFRPADDRLPANTIRIETSFSTCEYAKEDHSEALVLHTEDHQKPFYISYLSYYEVPVPSADELCSGEMYSLMAREGKEKYWIKSISTQDGEAIIGAYDYNTAYKKSQKTASVILIIFGPLLIVWAILGICVGRKPECFSPRLCSGYYKNLWRSSAKKKIGMYKKW